MRKGLLFGMGFLIALIVVMTSIPAQAGFAVRFHIGVPVQHVPPGMVQPPGYVPPPGVAAPPPIIGPPRVVGPPAIVVPPVVPRQPYDRQRPLYIPGRWQRTAWGWEWTPGFWIHR